MRALVLALSLLAALPGRALAPEARAYKERGDQHRNAGDAAAAVDSYAAAIRIWPRYAEAYEAMGEVQYGTRAYREAVESFGHAVDIDPQYALAWYNLGFAARKAGDLSRASEAYGRYVALKPSDPDGHLGLAEALRAGGDRASSLREYEAFVKLAEATSGRAAAVTRAKEAMAALRTELARGSAEPRRSTGAPNGTTAASPSASPAASPASPAAASTATAAAGSSTQRGGAEGPAASAAVADKIALGDRAVAGGDQRAALFAYQDAVYLDSKSAAARVKLGRTYAALRYPAQAIEQYELALAIDPGNAEARRGLDEAKALRAGGAGTPSAPTLAPASHMPPAASPTPAAPTRSQARVYRFVPEQEAPAPASAPTATAAPVADLAPAVPLPAAREQRRAPGPPTSTELASLASDTPGPSPAQRYRAAIELIGRREYARAIAELNEAIAQDPRLGVAYAARASAQFGLGRYREAAEDYKAALGLQPDLATPLYGLAECYRLLGDPGAAELYLRYAESQAADVREDLRANARRRAAELRR